MMTQIEAVRRLREASGDATVTSLLALAEEVIEGLVDTHEDEAAGWEAAASDYEGRIEDLVARDAPLDVFGGAIQQAHERAHHLGHWESCPNLVCRGLEEWMLTARKDGTT